jgi:hypothetical protein
MTNHWLRVALVAGLAAAVPLTLQAQNFPPPLDEPPPPPQAAPQPATPLAPKQAKKKKPAPPAAKTEPAPVVNLPVEPDGQPPPAETAPPAGAHPRSAAPGAPSPAGSSHAVACSGAFAKSSSHLKLAQVFGPLNLTFTEVDGPQNSKIMASVLYPKDPKRHLEVWWNNEGSRSDTSLIVINGQSIWTGPKGLHLGLPIAAVEKLNGKPFQIAGFDQDNAGSALDWQGGALDKIPGGCKVSVRVAADSKASEDARKAAAGKTLMSNDAAVRAVQPKIVEIIVGY